MIGKLALIESGVTDDLMTSEFILCQQAVNNRQKGWVCRPVLFLSCYLNRYSTRSFFFVSMSIVHVHMYKIRVNLNDMICARISNILLKQSRPSEDRTLLCSTRI